MASQTFGLSDDQVATLRDDLAAGRHPRVQIRAAQFGESASGTVQHVGDPADDGAEFVTVRVKLNGVADELRFAPRELSRGRRTKGNTPAKPALAPTATQQPPTARATPPATRTARSGAGSNDSAAQTETSPAKAAPTKTAAPTKAAPAKAAPAKAAPTRAAASTTAPRGRRTNSRGGAPRAAMAPVSIVLTSVGASWTANARRGKRTVVKNAPVDPGVVSAIAGLLAMAPLEDAVAAVNDTARIQAEARAEQLRTELAAVQAVLDSHRRPRTPRS